MAKTQTAKYLKIANLIDELNTEVQGYGYSIHYQINTLVDDVLLSVNNIGFFKEEMTLERALNFENPADQSDANIIGSVEFEIKKIDLSFYKESEQ